MEQLYKNVCKERDELKDSHLSEKTALVHRALYTQADEERKAVKAQLNWATRERRRLETCIARLSPVSEAVVASTVRDVGEWPISERRRAAVISLVRKHDEQRARADDFARQLEEMRDPRDEWGRRRGFDG
jgi:hypothetical protein